MTMYKCDDCSEIFKIKKNFQSHCAQTKHCSIKLICPWCLDKTHQFGLAQDLRRHVRNHHLTMHDSMPAKTLSTINCIYFSSDPEKHAVFHGQPEAGSEEALFAKATMDSWRSSMSRGDGTHHIPTTQPSSTPKRMAETQLTPTLTAKRTHSHINIKTITLTTNDIHCISEVDSILNLTKISPHILYDGRNLSSLTRRMTSINTTFLLPPVSWIMNSNPDINHDMASVLGIDDKYVTCTMRQKAMPSFEETSTVPQETPAPPTLSHISPDSSPSSTPREIRSPTPISLTPSPSPSYNPESPYMAPFQDEQEEVRKLDSNITPYTPTPIVIKPADINSTAVPLTDTDTYTPITKTPSTTTTTETSISVEQPITVSKDTTSTEMVVPVLDESTTITPTTVNSPTHTPISIKETPTTDITTHFAAPNDTISTIQEEALTLLKSGSYPMLPPAPREWSAVKEASVRITPSLLWPPHNWQNMAADQRTLQSEFAAMTLHSALPSPTLINRAALLHKYNFIVLPGCKGTTQTSLSLAQQYNFKLVREIATNTSTLSLEEQTDIIKSFYATQSPHLHAINHTPLRLQKKN